MTTTNHRPRYVVGVSEAINQHVFSSPEHEVGGVLVGEIHDSPAETIVRAAIPALEATSERASVTFTHDAWEMVHQVLEREHPGQVIVGWYHSHPGFGIFLSQHDLFIQENFFSGPGQLAHVVDPQAGTEGVFGWRDGAIASLLERPTRRPGLGGPPRVPPPEEHPAASLTTAGPPTDAPGPPAAATSSPPHPANRLPPATVALDRPAGRRGPRDSTVVVLIALLLGLALGFGLVAAARAAPPVVPSPLPLDHAGGHRP